MRVEANVHTRTSTRTMSLEDKNDCLIIKEENPLIQLNMPSEKYHGKFRACKENRERSALKLFCHDEHLAKNNWMQTRSAVAGERRALALGEGGGRGAVGQLLPVFTLMRTRYGGPQGG